MTDTASLPLSSSVRPAAEKYAVKVRIDFNGKRSSPNSSENVLRVVSEANSLWHFSVYIPEADEPSLESHVDIFFVQVLAQKKEPCHAREAAEVYMDLQRSILDHLSTASENIIYMIAVSPLRTCAKLPEMPSAVHLLGQCGPLSPPKRIPDGDPNVIEAIVEGLNDVKFLIQDKDSAKSADAALSKLNETVIPSEREALIKLSKRDLKEIGQQSQKSKEELRLAVETLIQKEATQGSAGHGSPFSTADILFVISKLATVIRTQGSIDEIAVDLLPALQEQHSTSKTVVSGVISGGSLAVATLFATALVLPPVAAAVGLHVALNWGLVATGLYFGLNGAFKSMTNRKKQNEAEEFLTSHDMITKNANELMKWLVVCLIASPGFLGQSEEDKNSIFRHFGIQVDFLSLPVYKAGAIRGVWDSFKKEYQKQEDGLRKMIR